MSLSVPLYANVEVRAEIRRSGVRANALRISSASPSANHSWSWLWLRSAKGSTATDFSTKAATAVSSLPSPDNRNLSASSTTTASANTPIIMLFSFLPVCGVMDVVRSTFLSSLMPSGVSSSAQAAISVGMNNTTSSRKMKRDTHSGRVSSGTRISVS